MKITYKLVGIKDDHHFTRSHDNATLDTMHQDLKDIGFEGNFDNVLFFANSAKEIILQYLIMIF